jgi:transposase
MSAQSQGPESVVREIKRRTRKRYNAEEKIRIVLEGLKGEASIAEICRREGMGKTTATRLHFLWIYGIDAIDKSTVASLYSDASINPLVADDNLESRDFYPDPDRGNLFIIAATGGCKQKRDVHTQSGLINEKIRALPVCDGIESIAKSEQTSRMMIVECDREKFGSKFTTAVNLEIRRHRNLILSANFALTERVLKRIEAGDWQKVQEKLRVEYPDHPKDRMFEHLAIIILYLKEFFRAAGKKQNVWELVQAWMKDQANVARDEIMGTDPIIQGFNLLRGGVEKERETRCYRHGHDEEEILPNVKLLKDSLLVKIEADEKSVRMTGTAGDYFSALSTAYKTLVSKDFPISSSRVLAQRLANVERELKEAGYSIVKEWDSHEKQNVYSITYDYPTGKDAKAH